MLCILPWCLDCNLCDHTDSYMDTPWNMGSVRGFLITVNIVLGCIGEFGVQQSYL